MLPLLIEILAEGITSVLVILIRIATRVALVGPPGRWNGDDYLVIVALLGVITALSTLFTVVEYYGVNQDIHTNQLAIEDLELRKRADC